MVISQGFLWDSASSVSFPLSMTKFEDARFAKPTFNMPIILIKLTLHWKLNGNFLRWEMDSRTSINIKSLLRTKPFVDDEFKV